VGLFGPAGQDLPDHERIGLNSLKALCGALLLADDLKAHVDALLDGL